MIEVEAFLAIWPWWAWYGLGCAHGVLVALYLPPAVAAVRRRTHQS